MKDGSTVGKVSSRDGTEEGMKDRSIVDIISISDGGEEGMDDGTNVGIIATRDGEEGGIENGTTVDILSSRDGADEDSTVDTGNDGLLEGFRVGYRVGVIVRGDKTDGDGDNDTMGATHGGNGPPLSNSTLEIVSNCGSCSSNVRNCVLPPVVRMNPLLINSDTASCDKMCSSS